MVLNSVVKAGLTTALLTLTINTIMVDSGMAERKLLNDLMTQYNKLERPVMNESEPVTLTFGLTLQQIIDVVSFNFKFFCEQKRIRKEVRDGC